MEIARLETNGFLLSLKTANIAIDAQDKKADSLLLSKADIKDIKPLESQVVIDSPGEYEVKNAMIDATALQDGQLGFSITANEVRVAYLGKITEVLTDGQLELLASADILILPAIGEKVETTMKIVSQIEPKAVIVYGSTDEQLALLKTEYGSNIEQTAKYKSAKKDFVETDTQKLVILD